MGKHLAQRAELKTIEAMRHGAGEIRRPEEAAHHHRKAIELALDGLDYSPENVSLMAMVAVSHVMLNECEAALPYLKSISAINPGYLKDAFYSNRWLQLCMTSEDVLPDSP